jgi:hypothetical protein
MLKLIKYRVGGLGMCLSGYTEEIALCGNTPPIVLDLAGFVVPNAVITPYGQCPPEVVSPIPITTNNAPHVFKNVNLIAGDNIFTLPASASSPVGMFQVTIRDSVGSDVSTRVLSISNTQIKITPVVPIDGVFIFVTPMATST